MNQKLVYQKVKSRHFCEIILMIILLFNTGIAQIYLDSTATVEERVTDLLGRMTLDEKIGQMVQVEYPVLNAAVDIQSYGLGSLLAAANDGPGDKTAQEWADLYDQFQAYAMQTRLGIPLLFSLDAVHGFGAVYGATVFPHNIGMGCTRNPQLVAQAAQVTAQEMAATGIDWVLGPVVAVARNENWGRTYESYAENPDLVAEMAAAVVPGFQGDTSSAKIDILACAKLISGTEEQPAGLMPEILKSMNKRCAQSICQDTWPR